MEEKRRRINLIGIAVPTIIMIIMLLYFLDVRSRAGEYDGLLISVLFYLSIIVYILIMIEEIKKIKTAKTKKEPLFTFNQLFIAACIILYIPVQLLLGFIVSTFLFTLIVQMRLGVKEWRTRIFVSSLMGIGLWFCFSILLKVKLPLGIFGLLGVFS